MRNAQWLIGANGANGANWANRGLGEILQKI